jgi:hypothetical protein
MSNDPQRNRRDSPEALRVLRDEGLRGVWIRVAACIGYRRGLLLERLLSEWVPPVDARIAVTFATIGEADFAEY